MLHLQLERFAWTCRLLIRTTAVNVRCVSYLVSDSRPDNTLQFILEAGAQCATVVLGLAAIAAPSLDSTLEEGSTSDNEAEENDGGSTVSERERGSIIVYHKIIHPSLRSAVPSFKLFFLSCGCTYCDSQISTWSERLSPPCLSCSDYWYPDSQPTYPPTTLIRYLSLFLSRFLIKLYESMHRVDTNLRKVLVNTITNLEHFKFCQCKGGTRCVFTPWYVETCLERARLLIAPTRSY